MKMNITDSFIEAMWTFSQKEMPEKVLQQAKLCLVDYVGCAYIGRKQLSRSTEIFLELMSNDVGKSSIIGSGRKTCVQNAALLNGMMAHTVELDDGHRTAMMHPGATVISALLSVAQSIKPAGKAGGKKFLKAIVIGYETCVRVASSIQPAHKLMGFHGTGTCGTIGSAFAVAYLLDVKKENWKAVLSAAATSAAGLLEVIDDASTLKPYNIGNAAVAGINAALIGNAGFVGPDDVLGGKRGFLTCHAKAVHCSYLLEGFAGNYAIELIYRKPYAACRHCHAAVEGALALRSKVSVSDIEAVHILTYDLAVKGHEHTEVKGISSAKMSMPYSVAAALVLGNADYEAFGEDTIENKEITDLAGKVKVKASDELSALVPGKRTAIVKVVTDKETYTVRIDYPKGEPENPISQEELRGKYYSLMSAAGTKWEKAEKLLNHIYNIEEQFNDFLQEI